jgi:hypothetical protein
MVTSFPGRQGLSWESDVLYGMLSSLAARVVCTASLPAASAPDAVAAAAADEDAPEAEDEGDNENEDDEDDDDEDGETGARGEEEEGEGDGQRQGQAMVSPLPTLLTTRVLHKYCA